MTGTFDTQRRLILASASPRRHEILKTAGIVHTVRSADADESLPAGITPAAAVEMLSARKAAAALERAEENDIILAADTVVALVRAGGGGMPFRTVPTFMTDSPALADYLHARRFVGEGTDEADGLHIRFYEAK